MSAIAFDKKFGAEFVARAPLSPGVYRYTAEDGSVLYVGKAKNLRRRLSNYRNATRKKVHRKMRTLVSEASGLSYECCESEEAALLREGQLIRALKPPYNIDGAYAFLYPSIGLGYSQKCVILCFTTHTERFAALDLSWYGCFRSRPRAKFAFDALIELLSLTSHLESSARLPEYPRLKGSRLVGLRQVPSEVGAKLSDFFAGESSALLGLLSRHLLAKPRARQEAVRVEEQLKTLLAFYQTDSERLRAVLRSRGLVGTHVSQNDRDEYFIEHSFGGRGRLEWG